MERQKPLLLIAIVLLCSTSDIDRPAAAQTIVPTHATRGTFVLVGFPPSDLYTDDQIVGHFDPHTVSESGTVDDPVGQFTWAAEHYSTVAPTSLLASGSMGANITFNSFAEAYSFTLSRFRLDFELTNAATLRIRGWLAVTGDIAWESGLLTEATASLRVPDQAPLFERSLFLPGALEFCHGMQAPAGTYSIRMYADVETFEGGFYAPNGAVTAASYHLLLTTTDCPLDMDGDAVVGLADLTRLLSNFGGDEVCSDQGDLDFDRDVDLIDLTTLLVDFGAICE